MPYFLPVFAFLIASIPVGLILGKQLRGIDIRQHGSGNIGTTNVFRTLGKRPGIICLILDILKGYLPVLLALNLLQFEGRDPFKGLAFLEISSLIPLRHVYSADHQLFVQSIHIVTALCAVLGHNYSPWLGFKGGKGIATSAGVMLALAPFAVLILIAIFLIVFLTTKYVSLASISAAAALPLTIIYGSYRHGRFADGTWNKPMLVFGIVIAIMAIWKHRTNIQRLMNGTEHRFSKKKPSTDS